MLPVNGEDSKFEPTPKPKKSGRQDPPANGSSQLTLSALRCQDQLVIGWLAALAVSISLLVGQLHLYDGHELGIVGWCTQAYSPLLGTMVARWSGLARTPTTARVHTSVFVAAVSLSVFYLILTNLFLVLAAPLRTMGTTDGADAITRLAYLNTRSLFLGILMVPLGAVITACFPKR
jgi:hypothetical protein